MSSTPSVSTPRRRPKAALAALSTLLIVGGGFAIASPAPAAAPAQSAAAAAPDEKPNVRVTKVTASSTSTASGTDVATTLRLKNVTDTPKSTRNTRLSLTNGTGTYRLGKAVVRPIRANGEITVKVSHTVKLTVPAGQYAVRACRGPVDAETCRTSAATVTVASAALVASPAALAFGDVKLGSAPARRDVTFTNSGKTPTGALTAAVTGNAFALASSTCATSLAPGASCTGSLVFTPSAPGAATGSLKVSGASVAATTVALSGTGLGAPVLTIDEDSFEFGDTLVGDSSAPVQLTVTNNGNIASGVPTVTLVPASTEDYEISANTCTAALAPAATCSVSVTFSPTAAGERTAAVNVSATPGGTVSTTLSGTGLAQAELVLTPPTAAFGSELVGDVTDPVTFTLTNSGDVASGTPTVVLGGIDADQFTIVDNGCTAALPADGTCTVDVAFAPTATGSASASLDASATPGGADTSPLTGTGETQPSLAISQASYDYGFTGAPAERTFTVTNTGTRTTGTPVVGVTGDAAFTVTTDTCTAPVPGGATCTVGVTYTGSGTAEQTAQLSVSASPGDTVTADLTGSPVALTVEPTSHDFGGVLVGDSSDPVSFTLTNHRSTTAVIDGEATIGAFTVDDSCFAETLPAHSTCTFTVRFVPTSVGPKSGNVDYQSNGVHAVVELSGRGLTPPSLSVDRSNIQFGAYAPATTTGTQVLTVTNTGTQPTAVAPNVSIAGPDAAEFDVTDTTCTGPVDGGDSCTFTLTFAPLTLSDAKSATATVNGPGSPTVGLAGISAPLGVTMVPSVQDFGTQTVGSSTIHVFRVVNTTEGGSAINSVSSQTPFSLDIPGDFTCVLSVDTVQPHSWCTISIAFRPTTTGFFSRTLTAGGDFGSASATMNGTGTSPAPVRGADSFSAPRARPMPTSVVVRNGKPVVLDS